MFLSQQDASSDMQHDLIDHGTDIDLELRIFMACVIPRQCRGVDTTPMSFFWNDHRTAAEIALKFCMAYGATFQQLLVKKMSRSDQVTELWRHMTYSLRPIFKESVFSATLLAAIDWNGDIMHVLGQ